MMQTSKAGTWSNRAFTLVEVLVALSIAAIGMLGLIQLQLSSMAAADKAEQKTQATLLAQSLIAESMAQGIAEEHQESGTDTRFTPPLHWMITISQERDLAPRLHAAAPLYRIEAQVTWEHSQQVLTLSRLYCPTASL